MSHWVQDSRAGKGWEPAKGSAAPERLATVLSLTLKHPARQ